MGEQVQRASKRLAGVILRIHPEGYGFVRAINFLPGEPSEFYIHARDFPDRSLWKEGTPVWFSVGPGVPGKAPKAVRVEVRAPNGKESRDEGSGATRREAGRL